MIIEINALDTLFFRDGKPFTMGEDVWANGMFPPNPSVIYGALRTKYFSEHPEDITKANEKDDPTKDLVIESIIIKKDADFLFPYPADCVKFKNNNKEKVVRMQIDYKQKNINSNYRILAADVNEKVESLSDSFMDDDSFRDYLSGAVNDFTQKDMNELVSLEPKIGIGKNGDTGTSDEGKLYRVGMIRPKNNLSIIIEFSNINIEDDGLIKLGGEGKAVCYRRINSLPELKKIEIENKMFCLYLLTPGIFKKGWLPEGIDEATGKGSIQGIDLELVTAAVGKPINIGGFDMKANKPKEMYKAVPAGTVYYFKTNSTSDGVIEAFNKKSISDISSKEGYGICFVGKIKGEI